jgi:hypothetical protein
VRGIAKIHFIAVNADPARPEATGDITANRRRHHRDDDQIEAGADLESRG